MEREKRECVGEGSRGEEGRGVAWSNDKTTKANTHHLYHSSRPIHLVVNIRPS